MLFTTEPMMVLQYGTWEIDDKPVTRKDGSAVENVALLDLDSDEIHRYSLAPSVGSDRPEPMTEARVVCRAQTAARGRDDGSVASKLKVTVTGFEGAKSRSRNGSGDAARVPAPGSA